MHRLTAYLSGTENSQPDYPLALASFGLNKRDAAVSYYSATVQYSAETMQAFIDRPDGKVYIQREDAAWEYFNVGHPLQYSIGATSATISLNGTRQETNASPETITVPTSAVVAEGINSTGSLTLDLIPGAVDVLPGDTVTWNGTDYLVTLLKFNARAGGQTLSINAQEITP